MPQQDDAPQKTGFLYGRLSRGETRREEEHYGLTPASRRARVRRIVAILRETGAFRGKTGFLYGRLSRGETRREEEHYGLTPASRRARVRRIVAILRETGAFRGEMTPAKLRGVFEALGPTFVKVGQILSMRSEILPKEYCDELAKLRADVDPMPYDEVVAAVEAEYGRPLKAVFATFDPIPLGSASVAQVHRATLLTGEDVAVKVQRPGVQNTMANDIDILRKITRHFRFLWRNGSVMDLERMVEEFWASFVDETNFLVEAANLREFKALNAGCAFVDCPRPYLDLCTEHILVMDYVDGISLEHPERLKEAGYDLEEIGVKLVDNYAKQVLDDGFFHADPHPGNIIVSERVIVYIDLGMVGRLEIGVKLVDNYAKQVLDDGFFHADPHPGNIIVSERVIVYIDLGMVGRLSARNRSCMNAIIMAVGENDTHAVVRGLMRLSVSSARNRSCMNAIIMAVGENDTHAVVRGLMRLSVSDPQNVDQPQLTEDVDAIVSDFGRVSLQDLDLGQMAFSLIAMARKDNVELPAVITMMARGLVTLEGVMDGLTPDANIIEIIRAHMISEDGPWGLARGELESLANESRRALHGTLEFGGELGEIARQLTRGQLKVNVGLADPVDTLEPVSRMVEHLTMGVVIAGLLVASSIVYFAGTHPRILGIPVIGLFGYLVAGGLALWIAIDTIRGPRRGKKGR